MLSHKESTYINQLFKSLKGNSITHIKSSYRGKFIEKKHNQVFEDIIKVATYLTNLGVEKNSKIGIVNNNNEYAFIILDLSLLYLNAIPIHISDEENIEDDNLILKLNINFCFHRETDKLRSKNRNQYSIAIIEKWIESNLKRKIESSTFKENQVFTYKRTSGTTGKPKYLAATTKSVNHLAFNIQKMFDFNSNDNMFLFLSQNIFLQRCMLYTAIISKTNIVITKFMYAFALLTTEKPTIIIGPSFFFDKLKERILNEQLTTNELKDSFCKIVGSKIRILWTGSSKSKLDTLHFFNDLGYPIYEGYGMSEFGMIAKNYPNNYIVGSVGPIFPDVEIKFDNNNQILVRSEYMPSKTYIDGKSFINRDGFLQTGDTGYLKNGDLYISGRIKNIITLANGKKVNPLIIKTRIMQIPYIYDVILFGDEKPYLTALIYIKDKTQVNYIITRIKEINTKSSMHYNIYKYSFIDNEIHFPSVLSSYKSIIDSFYN